MTLPLPHAKVKRSCTDLLHLSERFHIASMEKKKTFFGLHCGAFAGTHEASATFPVAPLSERTQRTARLRPGGGVAVSPGLPGEARLQLRRSQKHLRNLRGTAGVPPPTRCSSKNGLQEVGTSFFFFYSFSPSLPQM